MPFIFLYGEFMRFLFIFVLFFSVSHGMEVEEKEYCASPVMFRGKGGSATTPDPSFLSSQEISPDGDKTETWFFGRSIAAEGELLAPTLDACMKDLRSVSVMLDAGKCNRGTPALFRGILKIKKFETHWIKAHRALGDILCFGWGDTSVDLFKAAQHYLAAGSGEQAWSIYGAIVAASDTRFKDKLRAFNQLELLRRIRSYELDLPHIEGLKRFCSEGADLDLCRRISAFLSAFSGTA